jgi:hypothetical protein
MGCNGNCGSGKSVSAPPIETVLVNRTVSSSGSTQSSNVSKTVNINCGCKSSCSCKTNSPSCGSYGLEACDDDPVRAIYNPKIIACRSFNFPACGDTANVYIDPALYDLENLPEGSYLSNGAVGWLEIITYDPDTGILIVRNNCECTQPLSGGDSVAAGTIFILGAKPCIPESSGSGSGDRTYLCSTFFIPALNSRVTVQIGRDGTPDNSEAFVGATVRFQGYPFVVRALIDSDKIEIENTDAANPVNREINAGCDCSTIIAVFGDTTNPCENTSIASGKLLVCDGGSDLRPLVAPQDGMYLRSNGDNVEWVNLGDIDNFCTYLTASFTIDHLGADFVATVNSTSGFSETGANSLIILDGGLFKVIDIISATQVRLDPIVTPGGVIVYPINMSLCVASCCACPSKSSIVNIEGVPVASSIDISDVSGGAGGQYMLSQIDLEWANPSNCQKASAMIQLYISGAFRLGEGGLFQFQLRRGATIIYTHLIDTLNAYPAGGAPGAPYMNDAIWILPWLPVYPDGGAAGVLGADESYSDPIELFVHTQNGVAAGRAIIENFNIAARGMIVTQGV